MVLFKRPEIFTPVIHLHLGIIMGFDWCASIQDIAISDWSVLKVENGILKFI